jgi:hypothetical protein
LLCQTAEIFDEYHTQGDRHCPELTNSQRLYSLVGTDEASESFRIEAAISVRNERPGNPEDARIAPERSMGELGQFPVISGWQVVTNLTQLFVYDVKIVDQPLCCGRNYAFLADRLREYAIRLQQDASVFLHPRQQPTIVAGCGGHKLSGGQALSVLFEAFEAKEFRPNRFFELRRRDTP